MKYIIEIEDEPFGRNDDPNIPHGMDELYRAKGFNSLVFDRNGLDKLTSLNEALDESFQNGYHAAWVNVGECEDRVAKQAYQKGLNDAWEAARKIVACSGANKPLDEMFGMHGVFDIINKFSASVALTKLKAYEQQKADEIKVGDVITDGKINYLVIDITDKSYIALKGTDFEPSYIGKDYIKSYHNLHDSKDMQKIAEDLLKAMKGEQRDCHTCKHQVASSIECVDCRGFGKWEPKGDAE